MGIMRVSVALLFLSLSFSRSHTQAHTQAQECGEHRFNNPAPILQREKEGKESERVPHSKQSLGYQFTPSMVSGIRVITRTFGNFDQI